MYDLIVGMKMIWELNAFFSGNPSMNCERVCYCSCSIIKLDVERCEPDCVARVHVRFILTL